MSVPLPSELRKITESRYKVSVQENEKYVLNSLKTMAELGLARFCTDKQLSSAFVETLKSNGFDVLQPVNSHIICVQW